jgi:hypothetical protein
MATHREMSQVQRYMTSGAKISSSSARRIRGRLSALSAIFHCNPSKKIEDYQHYQQYFISTLHHKHRENCASVLRKLGPIANSFLSPSRHHIEFDHINIFIHSSKNCFKAHLEGSNQREIIPGQTSLLIQQYHDKNVTRKLMPHFFLADLGSISFLFMHGLSLSKRNC